MSDLFSPGQASVARSRNNSSAVKSLLGHAGQALGAVGVPSGRPTSSTTSGNGHPLSPTRSGRLGHPSHQPYPAQAPYIVGPPPAQLHQHQTSPSTTSSTATFPRLPPPVSVTGTGSGSGIGSGFHQQREQRAVSAVEPSRQPRSYNPSRYNKYQAGSSPSTSPTRYTPAGARQFSTSTSASSRSFSLAAHRSPTHASQFPDDDHRELPTANAIIPTLIIPTASGSSAATESSPVPSLGSRPMFDLPSIPTSNDDFAAIPYLNSANSSTSASTSSAPTPQNTMSQPPQQPPQYAAQQRRTAGYGDDQQQQQHHLQGSSQYGQQHGQMSPRGYSTPAGGPHIKLDQAPSNSSSYQSASAVPNVLQPGGPLARPAAVGNNTAPALPTLTGSISQQQDYQTPAKPQLNLSHSYSRSSPAAAAYDGPSNPGFSPYTPTTPNAGGPSSSQFMSPADRRYDAPGSQRNISHTPLGLADIRPRADSSLSDGMPAGFDLGTQNAPQGTSNYMAPWASYAFDWCKWAPQGNGAGKVAIGSYLEDGHNFVSCPISSTRFLLASTYS